MTEVLGEGRILLGNGDGTFTTGPTTVVGYDPVGMAVGDFNGDGIPDFAVVSDFPATVNILLGKGDGKFTIASPISVDTTLYAVAVGDFNGDGIPDLATAHYQNIGAPDYVGAVTLLLGNGDGTFKVGPVIDAVPSSVAVADFNGDGIPDLVTTNPFDGSVHVLVGAVATSAIAEGVQVPGGGIHHIFASHEGDSTHIGSTSGTWSVEGTKIATAAALAVSPGTTVTHGTTVQLTATIAPGEYANYIASGNVTFYNVSAAIGTATVTNGQTVLSTSSLPAGVYHLTAVYPGDTNFVASTSPEVTLTVE